MGFWPGPSDETLHRCIYRRPLCIFNAEEGRGPRGTLLLRHCYFTEPPGPDLVVSDLTEAAEQKGSVAHVTRGMDTDTAAAA